MLETQRLFIKPLTYEQLQMYIRNDASLEKELELNETSRAISPELAEALEQTILPNVARPDSNYLYATLWTLILKSQNKMVGDLCFVGEPNEAGEIEIGYGTYEAFRGNGFMTEAVGAMIQWALQQPPVKAIIASTDKTNIASFTILQKNNFVKVGETETLFKWRLPINYTTNLIKMDQHKPFPSYLAKPAQRALTNAGISTLEQLATYREEEIAKLHGIGQNALLKLKEALQQRGLNFKN